MKIFTKVAFLFRNPEKSSDEVRTRALDFAIVPEWVRHDLQFQRGLRAGEIEIIQSREQEIKAEHVAADGLSNMIKADAAKKEEAKAKAKAEAEAKERSEPTVKVTPVKKPPAKKRTAAKKQ